MAHCKMMAIATGVPFGAAGHRPVNSRSVVSAGEGNNQRKSQQQCAQYKLLEHARNVVGSRTRHQQNSAEMIFAGLTVAPIGLDESDCFWMSGFSSFCDIPVPRRDKPEVRFFVDENFNP